MNRYTVIRADQCSESDPVTDRRLLKFYTNDLALARAKAKEFTTDAGWIGIIWDWTKRDIVK